MSRWNTFFILNWKYFEKEIEIINAPANIFNSKLFRNITDIGEKVRGVAFLYWFLTWQFLCQSLAQIGLASEQAYPIWHHVWQLLIRSKLRAFHFSCIPSLQFQTWCIPSHLENFVRWLFSNNRKFGIKKCMYGIICY